MRPVLKRLSLKINKLRISKLGAKSAYTISFGYPYIALPIAAIGKANLEFLNPQSASLPLPIPNTAHD